MAAVKAIADGLEGTNKPLVVTCGTLAVAPDPNGGETDETSPLADSTLSSRMEVEAYGIGLASRGIRVTGIRLAAYVYGRGGSGVKNVHGHVPQDRRYYLRRWREELHDYGPCRWCSQAVFAGGAEWQGGWAFQWQFCHKCDGEADIWRHVWNSWDACTGSSIRGRKGATWRHIRLVFEGRKPGFRREGEKRFGVGTGGGGNFGRHPERFLSSGCKGFARTVWMMDNEGKSARMQWEMMRLPCLRSANHSHG